MTHSLYMQNSQDIKHAKKCQVLMNNLGRYGTYTVEETFRTHDLVIYYDQRQIPKCLNKVGKYNKESET